MTIFYAFCKRDLFLGRTASPHICVGATAHHIKSWRLRCDSNFARTCRRDYELLLYSVWRPAVATSCFPGCWIRALRTVENLMHRCHTPLRKMRLRQKATFVFPFVWPPPPYPRAMGTLNHPLALVHTLSAGLITESKSGDVLDCDLRCRLCSDEDQAARGEDQGRLFSSHNAMPCVVPAPSNAHAFTLVSGVQTGISSGIASRAVMTDIIVITCFTLVCATKPRQMATLIFHLFGRLPPF